mmetsp:Transcript_75381/g.133447  ORF Transcript_75381/g.133447 Transcript_75381/m.133447 type:complete len:95 (+) Transcript_75381:811-1095(+)
MITEPTSSLMKSLRQCPRGPQITQSVQMAITGQCEKNSAMSLVSAIIDVSRMLPPVIAIRNVSAIMDVSAIIDVNRMLPPVTATIDVSAIIDGS